MERNNRTNVWIIIAVVVGLILLCLWSMLFCGILGLTLFRATPPMDPAPAPPPAVPEPPRRGGGALITQVAPNSPAEAAGIQVGDIILALDGISLAEDRLPELIRRYEPGDNVTLTLSRGGREIDLRVQLATHPEQPDLPWIGIFYRELPQ